VRAFRSIGLQTPCPSVASDGSHEGLRGRNQYVGHVVGELLPALSLDFIEEAGQNGTGCLHVAGGEIRSGEFGLLREATARADVNGCIAQCVKKILNLVAASSVANRYRPTSSSNCRSSSCDEAMRTMGPLLST